MTNILFLTYALVALTLNVVLHIRLQSDSIMITYGVALGMTLAMVTAFVVFPDPAFTWDLDGLKLGGLLIFGSVVMLGKLHRPSIWLGRKIRCFLTSVPGL